MMTAIVEQKASQDSQVTRPHVPPSVLLIGKKRTLDYIAPALYRINNTGELIIKATGSLSIVTAVDVAEIVKRDVADIKTQSITIGTDELRVATGDLKRMSCIEIHLVKYSPIAVAQPKVAAHVLAEAAPPQAIEIPMNEKTTSPSSVQVDVPVSTVVVVTAGAKAKKPRAKRKSTVKKKTTTRKRKPSAA